MLGRNVWRPVARLVGSRSRANQLWAMPSHPARSRYSSSGSSSSPTGPSTSGRSLAAAAVIAGGAYAAYTLIWGPSGGGDGLVASGQQAAEPPSVKPTSVDDIAVASPVDILDLKAADAKIRQDTNSFIFRGKDGVQGRVDVARVSSNNPVEDNWAVGIGKSVGGNNFLFSGVYDGHA
jgi:pyruvate dehydrogenase phosphatase